jgi:hypothetical protein
MQPLCRTGSLDRLAENKAPQAHPESVPRIFNPVSVIGFDIVYRKIIVEKVNTLPWVFPLFHFRPERKKPWR